MRHSAKSFMRGRHLLASDRRASPFVALNAMLKTIGFDARLNATTGWRIPRSERTALKRLLVA